MAFNSLAEAWDSFHENVLAPRGHDEKVIADAKKLFYTGAASIWGMTLKNAFGDKTDDEMARWMKATDDEINAWRLAMGVEAIIKMTTEHRDKGDPS